MWAVDYVEVEVWTQKQTRGNKSLTKSEPFIQGWWAKQNKRQEQTKGKLTKTKVGKLNTGNMENLDITVMVGYTSVMMKWTQVQTGKEAELSFEKKGKLFI